MEDGEQGLFVSWSEGKKEKSRNGLGCPAVKCMIGIANCTRRRLYTCNLNKAENDKQPSQSALQV